MELWGKGSGFGVSGPEPEHSGWMIQSSPERFGGESTTSKRPSHISLIPELCSHVPQWLTAAAAAPPPLLLPEQAAKLCESEPSSGAVHSACYFQRPTMMAGGATLRSGETDPSAH